MLYDSIKALLAGKEVEIQKGSELNPNPPKGEGRLERALVAGALPTSKAMRGLAA